MSQAGPAANRKIGGKLERLLRMLVILECLLCREVYTDRLMLLRRAVFELECILFVQLGLR